MALHTLPAALTDEEEVNLHRLTRQVNDVRIEISLLLDLILDFSSYSLPMASNRRETTMTIR